MKYGIKKLKTVVGPLLNSLLNFVQVRDNVRCNSESQTPHAAHHVYRREMKIIQIKSFKSNVNKNRSDFIITCRDDVHSRNISMSLSAR